MCEGSSDRTLQSREHVLHGNALEGGRHVAVTGPADRDECLGIQ